MPTASSPNLAGMTVKQAADHLARRAAVVAATGRAGPATKTAAGFLGGAAGLSPAVDQFAGKAKDWLGGQAGQHGLGDAAANVKGWWGGLDPWAQSGIEGAGLGALAGGALGLAKDDDDERHPFSSALTGALAGGALGAGGHLAYDQLRHLKNDKTQVVAHPPAGGVPAGNPRSVPVADRPAYSDGRQRLVTPEDQKLVSDSQAANATYHQEHPEDPTGTVMDPAVKSRVEQIAAREQLGNRAVQTGESALHQLTHLGETWDDAKSDPSGEAKRIGEYALPWAPKILNNTHDYLRRRNVNTVQRAALNVAGDSKLQSRFGVTPEQMQQLANADPAVRDAWRQAIRGEGDLPAKAWQGLGDRQQQLADLLPARGRPSGTMPTVPPPEPLGRLPNFSGDPHQPPQYMFPQGHQPPVQVEPRYGGVAAAGGGVPGGIGKSTWNAFKETARAAPAAKGVAPPPEPRAPFWKPFARETNEAVTEHPWFGAPRRWSEMGVGGRAGRVASYAIPLGLDALAYGINHSGPTPSENLIRAQLDPNGAIAAQARGGQ